MAERVKQVSEQVREEISSVQEQNIAKLVSLWSETFEPDIVIEHVKKLVDHVQTFYADIFDESKARQEAIVIQIKKLYDEAAELKRQLKVDIKLTPDKKAPLYSTQMYLDESLHALRARLEQRRQVVADYLAEQELLCEEMEESKRVLSTDSLPSDGELAEFREYLDEMISERQARKETISQLQRSVRDLLKPLELILIDEDELQLVNSIHLAPTKRNIRLLTELEQCYAEKLEEMKNAIEAMRKKLATLWDFLQIGVECTRRFERHTDYTQTTYTRLYEEVNRCETIKRENIQQYVLKVRNEIIVWWDLTMKSKEERDRFTTFHSDVFNEDVLTLHEMELESLKSFYEQNEKFFTLFDERKKLWERMEALENKSNDPARYTNRGGQLLKEEKERKTIAIRLPKIEAQLKDLAKAYEEQHGRRFTVEGEPAEEVIDRQWEQRRQEKQSQLSSRKKAAGGTTPISTQKLPLSVTRTPRTAGTTTMRSNAANSSAASTRSCSRAMTTSARLGLKRKLSPVDHKAKRSLLKELNKTNSFVKPMAPNKITRLAVPKTTLTNPGSLRHRAAQQRRSLQKRRSQGKRMRPRNNGKPSDSENSMHSDSVSYDAFEEHISRNTPCRSSMQVRNTAALAAAAAPGTPVKLSTITGMSTMTQQHSPKTPLHGPRVVVTPASHSLRSPSPSGRSKKLTTKNLPILI